MTLLHSLYDHSIVLLFHNTQLLHQSHQIGDVPSHPDGMGACGYIPYQLLHSACRTEPSVTTSSLACSQVRWALLGKWDQGEGTTDSFSNSLQKKIKSLWVVDEAKELRHPTSLSLFKHVLMSYALKSQFVLYLFLVPEHLFRCHDADGLGK